MRAYLLIDLADCDDPDTVLGVYGTHAEAVKAERRTGAEEHDRYSEIQLWEGPNLVKQWMTTKPKLNGKKIEYEWKVI